MKCNHCSYESEDSFAFCPRCGVATQTTVAENPIAERITLMLKDPLFLALCVLISCATFFSLCTGSISVLYILATVFLWLLFSQSRKETVNADQLRNLSGTVYASYVITNVLYVLLGICGIALLFCFGSVTAVPADLLDALALELSGTLELPFMLPSEMFASALLIISILFILIAAGGIVINYFSMGNIHKFLKSVYKSVESGNAQFVKFRTAYGWLIALGVLNGINAVSSLFTSFLGFLANGSLAAAMIVAGVYIDKYFPKTQ